MATASRGLLRRLALVAIPAALALTILAWPAAGHGQSDVWQSRTDAGHALYRQARYGEAQQAFEEALEEAERLGPRDPRLAVSLNNLAEYYRGRGDYDRSEALHRRALRIKEETAGPNDPSVAATLGSLAELHRRKGSLAEAETLYRRAIAIYEKAWGAEHVLVATGLNNLALLYVAQERYAEAEPLYRRALAILEKAKGREDASAAVVRRNYGSLLRQAGRDAEAVEIEARAGPARMRSPGDVPP